MFNLTRKMKNCIISILVALLFVSMGTFITLQKSVKAEDEWIYIDTIAERVWHDGDSNTMHIYTTAILGDEQGNAYNWDMDYGTLAVKINGQESDVALRYGGLKDIMFTMDAPVAGQTTFEIEAGTVVQNPPWVKQVYRFTETAKFIYNASGEWVAEEKPVEKTYVETGVIVDWHGTTAEYPNNSIVLVMDQNYHANGSSITGTLGTLNLKVDGVERTVEVFDWYSAADKLAFNCEVVPGTTIEIEPNTVVEVASDVERTYKFTEGCSYIYNGASQVWEKITYVEGVANRVWYDGTYLQIYIDPYFTKVDGSIDKENIYEYLMNLGKLDVKLNGQLVTKEVKHLGYTALGIDMDTPVAGETTFEIVAGTAVKNSPWTSRMYKFTSGISFIYNASGEWVDPNAPQVYKVNVSANDGSSFSVDVNAGESYTLPAKVNEKVVLGYVIGGINYMAGESITVNGNVEVAAKVVAFSMIDGAEIRVGFEKGGIRFAANINYDELASTGYVIEKVGFMIIPTDYLANTEFKYENFTANDKDGFVDVELSTFSTKSKITATMIDLDESLYNKKFSARAYVKYTVDGESKYVYTDYDQGKNSRSCYEVALSALADSEMEEYYSELKEYCDNIIDLTETNGQVSITENEYSEYSTLAVESATVENGVLTVKITGITVNAGTGILYNGVRYTSVMGVEKGEGYVQFSIVLPVV